MRKVELLAPVGSREALVAAVWNGADAVYLAGKAFGARKYASNFEKEELIDSVKFCHKHGVSVFVTVNTLVADSEFEKLIDYIDFLYKADVDAVIVQDFGVLETIRKRYPDFELHGSTQMTAHSTEDIYYLKAHGVRRVVLPREMPLEEIAQIRKQTDIDFECFVHGALCISYSGQCLMSSLIGGRSGNRGSCAQSCRQPYTLMDMNENKTIPHNGGKYLLSPKDLRALDEIPALIEAGVNSFKIEGRMKRAEYTAVVVKAYREAIDAALAGEPFDVQCWEDKTAGIFSRGFTGGHLLGDTAADRMSQYWPGNQGVEVGQVIEYDKKRKRMKVKLVASLHVGDEVQIRRGQDSVGARVEFIEMGRARIKEAKEGQNIVMNMQYPVSAGEHVHKTVDDMLLKEARGTFARQVQRVQVDINLKIESGKPIQLTMRDQEGHKVVKEGAVPEKAMNKALDMDRVRKQILKLGDSPYYCELPEILIEDGLALSMKDLNGLRREVVQELDNLRTLRYPERESEGQVCQKPEEDTSRFEVYKSTIHGLHMEQSSQNCVDEEDTCKYTMPKFQVQVRTEEQLDAVIEADVDSIIVTTLKMLEYALELEAVENSKIIFAPGRIVRNFEYKVLNEKVDLIKKCAGIWAGTYGIIIWAKEHKIKVLGLGQGLNIFNSQAVKGHVGEAPCFTLSPEMTMEQIKVVGSSESSGLESIVYGRQSVMITEYCPISATIGDGRIDCGRCEQIQYGLQDKKGAIFPIIRSSQNCRTEILNSKILFVPEDLDALYDHNVRTYRMVFTLESGNDTRDVINLFKHTMEHDLTTEDETTQTAFISKGLTRGHYYRGVMDE